MISPLAPLFGIFMKVSNSLDLQQLSLTSSSWMLELKASSSEVVSFFSGSLIATFDRACCYECVSLERFILDRQITTATAEIFKIFVL